MADMDELRFDGKVAIVTGAGRGIGREHALMLASRGAAVLVNDLGAELDGSDASPGPASDVVEEIRANGGQAIANGDSVATEAGAVAIVSSALDAFGRLDVVINNAGVQVVRPFLETTFDSLRLHLDVHLGGSFLVTRAAWPHLIASGAGRVVNTTSAASLGLPGYSAYGAAKAALIGLTRTLAVEGRDVGIRVNAVSPMASTRMMVDGSASIAKITDGKAVSAPLAPAPVAFVATVVALLSHDRCPCSGEVFTAGRGRVTRMVFAETRGIRGDDLSVEAIAEQFDRVLDDASLRTMPDGLGRAMPTWS
jgi:NAD(P)-dependent dehydrogenase (short-subunit alcohol dehydrogenase family)